MYILIGMLLVCSFKTTGILPRPEVGRLDQPTDANPRLRGRDIQAWMLGGLGPYHVFQHTPAADLMQLLTVFMVKVVAK